MASFAQISQMKIANNSLGKLHTAIGAKADANAQLKIVGEGIKAIEAAEKDKRTRNWPETWAIKAYLSSYVALIDGNETNSDKYFNLAVTALNQAKKLDKFQSNAELIMAADHNIHTKTQKEAVAAFRKNDFSTAFPLLKKVSDFYPTDTLLASNTAICAQNLQDYDSALTYYLRAKDAGIRNQAVFQQIASIYTSKFESELAIKTLEEALKLNPNSVYLTNDYVNMLLDAEQYGKATKVIEGSLASEKNNSTLYYLYGYLQQNYEKNNSTAQVAYKRALDIDQNYFDALYQLGVTYLSEANEALSKKEAGKFRSFVNRAEFSLLRAHEININHRNTVKLLIDIYTRKNRLDKVQDLKRKLNEFY
jgi:tetratricopeptide (TPR) repeat protein